MIFSSEGDHGRTHEQYRKIIDLNDEEIGNIDNALWKRLGDMGLPRPYFVANSGDDSNEGSPQNPWRTMTYAEQTFTGFKAGDSVCFKRGDAWGEGTYELGAVTPHPGSAEGNFTIRAYGTGAKPVINSTQPFDWKGLIVTGDQCSYVTLQDIVFAGGMKFSNFKTSAGPEERIRVIRCETYDSTANDPNDTNQHGLHFASSTAPSLNTFNDVLIDGCTIYNNRGKGIQFGGFGIDQVNLHETVTIRNNHIYDNFGAGMYVVGARNTQIHDNKISATGAEALWGAPVVDGPGGAGILMLWSQNSWIYRNDIRDTIGHADSVGIQIDVGCDNTTIERNYSENCAGGFARMLGDSQNCTYRYNISYYDGGRQVGIDGATQSSGPLWVTGFIAGQPDRDSENHYIYNNTIVTRPGDFNGFQIKTPAKGVLFQNNILMMEGGTDTVDITPGEDGTNVFYQNNIVHRDSYVPTTWYNTASGNIERHPELLSFIPLFENEAITGDFSDINAVDTIFDDTANLTSRIFGITEAGRDKCVKLTVDATSSNNHMFGASKNMLDVGELHRIQFEFYIPSSNAVVDGLRSMNNTGTWQDKYTNMPRDVWHVADGSLTPPSNQKWQVKLMDGTSNIVLEPTGSDYVLIRRLRISKPNSPISKVAAPLALLPGDTQGVRNGFDSNFDYLENIVDNSSPQYGAFYYEPEKVSRIYTSSGTQSPSVYLERGTLVNGKYSWHTTFNHTWQVVYIQSIQYTDAGEWELTWRNRLWFGSTDSDKYSSTADWPWLLNVQDYIDIGITALRTDSNRPLPIPTASETSASTKAINVPAGYSFVWGDQFEDPTLDPDKWFVGMRDPVSSDLIPGADGDYLLGTKYAGYVTEEDVFIENECLVLQNQKRTYVGTSPAGTYDYTSGWVTSMHRGFINKGYVEVRAKFPTGDKLWPAIWMIAEDIVWGPEWDLWEYYGFRAGSTPPEDQMGLNLMTGYEQDGNLYPNEDPIRFDDYFIQPFDGLYDADIFHTYGFEWTDTYAKWWIDGVNVHTLFKSETLAPASWPNENMYFVLNNSVRTSSPDFTTTYPNRLEIDYIEVYQK